MMAAWVLYTLLTSLLLVIAGGATERLALALGVATRLSWTFVVIVSLALSGAALASRTPAKSSASVTSPDHAVVRLAGPPDASAARRTTSRQILPRGKSTTAGGATALARRLRSAVELRIDTARWQRYDTTLRATCATLAAAGVLVVIVSLIRLRRMTKASVRANVDGMPVLLSHDIGPAALGFLQRQVVIPRWIMALPVEERRTILLHEREHAAAGDPMLVVLGALALALQPWNLLLWIAVARLRFAVEADCDARVLRLNRCGARRYGALLLRVHEHGFLNGTRGRLPVTAFVDSTSHLERRVRRMTSRQPKLRSLSTSAACVAALLVAATAFSVRVSDAKPLELTPKTRTPMSAPATRIESTAAPVESKVSEVAPDAAPLWRDPLPQLANSERESHGGTVSIVAPPLQRPVAGVPAMERDTAHGAFVPETLLVRASNSMWAMKARITVADSAGVGRVLVTDTLGRELPSADKLVVNGPVRLVLPDAHFQLDIESLSGDLAITTSVLPAHDAKGSRWVSTLLGRGFHVARRAAGESLLVSTNGSGVVASRRVR